MKPQIATETWEINLECMRQALSLFFHCLVYKLEKSTFLGVLFGYVGLSWVILTEKQKLTNIINTNKERHGNKTELRTLRGAGNRLNCLGKVSF